MTPASKEESPAYDLAYPDNGRQDLLENGVQGSPLYDQLSEEMGEKSPPLPDTRNATVSSTPAIKSEAVYARVLESSKPNPIVRKNNPYATVLDPAATKLTKTQSAQGQSLNPTLSPGYAINITNPVLTL